MRWIIESVTPARRRARHWIRRGNAARDRRDWPAAREAYGHALEEHPPLPPIWVQYGHAAKESGDLPGAEAAYRRALELRPGFADGHLHLGHALKQRGRPAEALEAYARAAALAPADPECQLQLGHALNGLGRRVAAVEAFRRASALAPGRAEAALELGHALLALGEPVGALEAFRQAFRVQPEQPVAAWVQHGHAARGAGAPAAAEAAYRRALELDPEAADTHLHLGHVLRQQDRREAALAAFRRAAELAPADGAAQAHRAAVFEVLPPLEQANGVSLDAVRWAMRFFLGREPAGIEELERHMGHGNLESLRRAFAEMPDFAAFYRDLVPRRYAVPLFLLAPPASPQVPWRFEPPRLDRPVSQLCTAGQLAEPAYAAWCGRFALQPTQHRKPWEFCYIGAALEAAGLLREGSLGLGFGCGQEPLPSYFAARGVAVTATDAPAEVVADQGWQSTNDHAAGLDAVHRPELVSAVEFRRLVRFGAVDMNRIPDGLAGFDFCWSACALEHLGSLRAGLDFIVASLGTLRPGGVAVHTTDFNLSSDDATMETPGLSVFRRQDIEALIAGLTTAGHEVAPSTPIRATGSWMPASTCRPMRCRT
ncbi:tetratricopeptide repeat protein [Paeniroseomonas aquatica]|uniref:tetratricopeptide repeat protein n=1 Tax=Paeniroseomonas aquatica TaxID=373043 RepID=UPI0036153816